ncbi:MAG: hypothetical protein ACOX3V_00295 [Bacillota bacterium]|jgi:hypothetical protein
MLVGDFASKFSLKVLAMSREGSRRPIEGGFVGDVLSHVMANALPGYVWVTVQTHENIVAVASLLDVACVVVCQRELPSEVIKKADAQGVTLLWSGDSAFALCGRMYASMNAGARTGESPTLTGKEGYCVCR